MLKSSSLCLYSSNLDNFWLKIGQFWPFEEISIFSKGGHLGYRTAVTDTTLKGSFQQSLVEIGSVVSEEKNFFYFIPPFFKLPFWVKIFKSSKFIKNPVIYVIILLQFKFGHFWLKTKQFWPFEKNSIFCNGGHLRFRTALTDTILKGIHPRIISAKFGWDRLSSFRGENLF